MSYQIEINDYANAIALRRMAENVSDLPFYLLANEVNLITESIDNYLIKAFIETLWNTGCRMHEALNLRPIDFIFDKKKSFVIVKTLKQRKSKNRIIPIFDKTYEKRMIEVIQSYKIKDNEKIWDVSHDTAERWIKKAIEQNKEHLSLNKITSKTFRHSFAMHLLYNRVHPKMVQTLLGHKRLETTEIYTRVFALDLSSEYTIQFNNIKKITN